MKSPILVSDGMPLVSNRDESAPLRIHIVPRGELPHKASGVVQVLDDESLDSIMANIEADRTRMGDKWPGIYMGEEHFVYDSGKSSEAFAWAKEFERDEQGIWAVNPDLTDVGRPAVDNKRFKYTSFVTDPNVSGSVEKLDGNRVRIKRIDTVGFTNYANGRHLLTPVKNRLENGGPGSGPPLGNQNAAGPHDMGTHAATGRTIVSDKLAQEGSQAAEASHRASQSMSWAIEKESKAGRLKDGSSGRMPRHIKERADANKEQKAATFAFHETRKKSEIWEKQNKISSVSAWEAHNDRSWPHYKMGGGGPPKHISESRAGGRMKNTFAGPDGSTRSGNTNQRKPMNSVCTLLGLHAEADEQSVHEAVSALKNRVAELEPFEQQNEILANRLAEHDDAEVDGLIAAKGIAPDDARATHIKPVLLKMANRADRVSFLDACVIVETKTKPQVKLLNRDTRGPGKHEPIEPGTHAHANQIGSAMNHIRNRDKCSVEVAMATARAERPELFETV